jgi:flagellar hook-basal body complex protein FliE
VSVPAISFLPPVTGTLPAQGAELTQAQAAPGASFADFFTKQVGEMNQQLLGSQADLRELALGGTESLHQVMIRLEQTRIAFQLMVQVRNRLLESYQDVMRMQV